MPITFDEKRKIFKLDTLDSTYAIGVREGYLIHLYYGKKISDDNLWSLPFRGGFATISPKNVHVDDYRFSLDVQPMEYSCNGSGDYRLAALSIKDSMGRTTTDIRLTIESMTESRSSKGFRQPIAMTIARLRRLKLSRLTISPAQG